MERILSARGTEQLARFAAHEVLLAFDFDGTLAPIVREPSAAQMRPQTRMLLAALTGRYPCAVVTGRVHGDACERVPEIEPDMVIGNHGIVLDGGADVSVATISAACARLSAALESIDGVFVENKGLSLAIHYRNALEHREVRRAIDRAIRRLAPRLRHVPGKAVVNLTPTNAGDKGIAIERLMHRVEAQRAIFVGDDTTDEDAFALARSREMLAIRVGACRKSAATHFIRDQREIDALLRRLVIARSV